MKRFLLIAFLTGFTTLAPPVGAQDAASAAAAAERAEAEERYRRLAAIVDALQTNNDALSRKLKNLEERVIQLRDDAAKPTTKYATPDDLNRLVEKIKELDDQRKKDKEAILGEIAKLGKVLKDTPAAPVKPTTPAKPLVPRSEVDKGYEHAVQKGEFLSTIVSAYNEEFKKIGKKTISIQQVLDANPGLNASKMKIGQKIFIPLPE